MTEYFIEGRFPPARRILGIIGPRKTTWTKLHTEHTTTEEGFEWRGEVDMQLGEIPISLHFESDKNGDPFPSENALIDFLAENFRVTYLIGVSKPAVNVR